ncbi:GNAT family N-acetyltransferase [Kutzneria sp. 744]|uniref:GNAT family N-acetyltransferase n=1 Tax=Kutzneria sp. (strain 744) TaxID=345341 RepID=UPI0003EED09B|nr:GNAT family N-acetyltransferase [Kutzneria sp. 744]EWM11890.1 acetyltransferase, GNAT family [Kutzneria sp. 744]
MTPTIRTERLLLEPYDHGDEETFVVLVGDEAVNRYVGDGALSEQDARALFLRVFPVYEENRFDVWAVREDGRHIGHAEIKPSKTIEGHELVYVLAEPAWGRGLGTELATAIVAYGFDTLGLDRVYATVHEDNAASLHTLGKIGFVHDRDMSNEDGHVTRVLVAHRDRAGEGTLPPRDRHHG